TTARGGATGLPRRAAAKSPGGGVSHCRLVASVGWPDPQSRLLGLAPESDGLLGVGVGRGGVGAACGCGEFEVAGLGLGERPAGQGLELVVGPAAAAKIAGAGAAALVPGEGVIQVGAPGGLAAAGLAAGLVAGVDVVPDPR